MTNQPVMTKCLFPSSWSLYTQVMTSYTGHFCIPLTITKAIFLFYSFCSAFKQISMRFVKHFGVWSMTFLCLHLYYNTFEMRVAFHFEDLIRFIGHFIGLLCFSSSFDHTDHQSSEEMDTPVHFCVSEKIQEHFNVLYCSLRASSHYFFGTTLSCSLTGDIQYGCWLGNNTMFLHKKLLTRAVPDWSTGHKYDWFCEFTCTEVHQEKGFLWSNLRTYYWWSKGNSDHKVLMLFPFLCRDCFTSWASLTELFSLTSQTVLSNIKAYSCST